MGVVEAWFYRLSRREREIGLDEVRWSQIEAFGGILSRQPWASGPPGL